MKIRQVTKVAVCPRPLAASDFLGRLFGPLLCRFSLLNSTTPLQRSHVSTTSNRYADTPRVSEQSSESTRTASPSSEQELNSITPSWTSPLRPASAIIPPPLPPTRSSPPAAFETSTAGTFPSRSPVTAAAPTGAGTPSTWPFDVDFASSVELDAKDFLRRRLRSGGTTQQPELRLRPSAGRTVNITGSVDVARAFRVLGIQTSRNQMKRDLRLQRYHERPGLKRKRLVGERWRKRFRGGFVATVVRVQQLKKMGW